MLGRNWSLLATFSILNDEALFASCEVFLKVGFQGRIGIFTLGNLLLLEYNWQAKEKTILTKKKYPSENWNLSRGVNPLFSKKDEH